MPEWLLLAKADIQFALFGFLFLLALARGAAPERVLSGALVSMFVLDRVYHLAVGGSLVWHRTDLGHLGIDIFVMAAAWFVAVRANRVYPLWIGAAQIIALSAHAYRFSMSEINRFAYDAMQITPSYVQLAAMTLGLGFHMWRQRKLGSYPSWRSSFIPTPAVNPGLSRGV
jgi:hypothetical protein